MWKNTQNRKPCSSSSRGGGGGVTVEAAAVVSIVVYVCDEKYFNVLVCS